MTREANSTETLMELEREAYRRQSSRDLDWLIAAHAEDALFLSPGSEIKPAQEVLAAAKKRAETETVQNDGSSFSWEPISARVSASEDMGYVYGSTKMITSDGEEEHGKYVSIWIKENEQWKVAVEIRD